MTVFIQNDATGAGAGSLDAQQGFVDLAVIANGDTLLGLDPAVGNRQPVTYTRTDPGIPPTRLDTLVNTGFSPDYGGGPQNVDILILPVLANFTLNDGTMVITVAGAALPPQNSGLAGSGLNTTNNCLVVYDTTQSNGNGYCTARASTPGVLDLPFPNAVILYHELSHALRAVTNAQLAVTGICDPASPEESAAIVDENDLRTQTATALGTPAELRDSAIHCGFPGPNCSSCCIVASVASGSPLSDEVVALRAIRDGTIRKSDVGYAFFESLHYDYYGFSPQVCTLMARHPALRPLVLDGFVRPLVTILRVIEHYAFAGGGSASLGERFAADHADRAAAAARSCLLARARAVLDGDDRELSEEERNLARLLRPATASEHLRWAIIDPVRIYQAALRLHLDGWDAERLGEHLAEEIRTWAPRMPLDDVWGALTTAERDRELGLLDATLLRTPAASMSFRERLVGVNA